MSSDKSLRITTAPSPVRTISPHRLLSLLLTPRAFFSHPDWIRDRVGIVIAAFLVGVTNAIDRIDQNLIKAGLPHQGADHADSFMSWVTSSWLSYWALALVGGCVSATVSWYLRGWWYRKRLEWCGAGEVAPDDARSLSVLQDLVYVLPMVLLALFETASYPNYAEAWAASDNSALLIPLFLLWSCRTSYCGAITVFTLKKNKARIWFLAIPLAFSLLVMGVLSTLIYTLTR